MEDSQAQWSCNFQMINVWLHEIMSCNIFILKSRQATLMNFNAANSKNFILRTVTICASVFKTNTCWIFKSVRKIYLFLLKISYQIINMFISFFWSCFSHLSTPPRSSLPTQFRVLSSCIKMKSKWTIVNIKTKTKNLLEESIRHNIYYSHVEFCFFDFLLLLLLCWGNPRHQTCQASIIRSTLTSSIPWWFLKSDTKAQCILKTKMGWNLSTEKYLYSSKNKEANMRKYIWNTVPTTTLYQHFSKPDPQEGSSEEGCFLPTLATWVQSLGSTWYKERTDS